MHALPIDEEIRALAGEILAREEFARWREEPGAFSSTVKRVMQWLSDAVDWLLPDGLFEWLVPDWLVPFLGGQLTLLHWLFVALLLGLLTGGAVLIARAVRGSPRERETADAQAAPLSAEDALLAEAESLADAGRFLEAAHSTQLAALQLMLERRWLELGRSEPNRTLRRRLGEAPLSDAEKSHLVGLLDRLEARWFRDRNEDPLLYEDWRALYARLRLARAS